MKMTDVLEGLRQMREAREAWGRGRTEFFAAYDIMLTRYMYEAFANSMSVEHIANALNVTPKTIRTKMRSLNLDPRAGVRALNKAASQAMLDNAALMGIDPRDMDLTSPLAYLPMGSDLRRKLDEQRLKAAEPEFPETEVERLTAVFKAAWHERDAYWRAAEGTDAESESDRTQAGIRAVLAALA